MSAVHYWQQTWAPFIRVGDGRATHEPVIHNERVDNGPLSCPLASACISGYRGALRLRCGPSMVHERWRGAAETAGHSRDSTNTPSSANTEVMPVVAPVSYNVS